MDHAAGTAGGVPISRLSINLHDGLTGPQIASELSCGKSVVVVFVTGSLDQIPPDYAGAITKRWFSEALEQVVLLVRTHSWDSVDPPQADLSLVRMAPSFQGKSRTEGK